MRALPLIALFALGPAGNAFAGDGGAPGAVRLELAVGQAQTLPAAMQVICDDLTVVGVEGGGPLLVLRGLKPGRTLCGISRTRGLTTLYVVVVVAK